MATKLQCEICGGKLIGKPGGVFECENCGTEYSTAWAKEKIQEITGTVKVEGTVEVTGKVQVEGGTVQIEGTANADSFLRRGELALEDQNWEEATEYFNKVLDIEPENAKAYFGKLLAKRHCKSAVALKTTKQLFEGDVDFQKALRFADKSFQGVLNDTLEANKKYIEALKLERAEQEKIEQCKREEEKKAEQRKREEEISHLISTREKYKIANTMLAVGSNFVAGLKSDGTVLIAEAYDNISKEVSAWEDIIAIAAGNSHIVGLKANGTVVAAGINNNKQCDVRNWREIVAIDAAGNNTIGLRADGTVVATGQNKYGECDVRYWKDIEFIHIGEADFCDDKYTTLGRQKNGAWVYTGCPIGQGTLKILSASTDVVSVIRSMDGAEKYVNLLKVDGSVEEIVLASDGAVSEIRYIGRDRPQRGSYYCDRLGFISIAGSTWIDVKLRPDGTVVSEKNREDYAWIKVSKWSDIVAVFVGSDLVIGLKADGTAVAEWQDSYYSSGRDYTAERMETVMSWKLFGNIDTIEEERKAAAEKAEAERKVAAEKAVAERKAAAEKAVAERKAKIEALNKEQAVLQTELSNLHGLFTGKRRREIETRLAEIEAELKKLQ